MSYSISQLTIDGVREVTSALGGLKVLEYLHDPSVAPDNAESQYFMSKMNVRKRQVIADLSEGDLITQAGAMQMMIGYVEAATNVKGIGGFMKGIARGAVTGESAIKPKYQGSGVVLLEPTYKYIILQDLQLGWGGSIVVEDGMFLASMGNVEQKAVMRKSVSGALASNEGLFSLGLYGEGVVALESNVPLEETIIVDLEKDVLKIDGSNAMAWSESLDLTVERTTSTLVGSAATKEGLVNVYRGTGRVMISPTAPTRSLASSTHS
jgi:uncharacterized protein (AIM24 family)